MKTVKIKFIGFWSDFTPEDLFIYKTLTKFYNVVITDNPDYIICSCCGTPYEYCNYPQIRIMVAGENYIPDFNFIDYAISMYPINFLDRSFYRPISQDTIPHFKEIETKEREYTAQVLERKKYFANFITGHESENGIRGNFFKKLSEYKRIESAGTYLNNMPNSETVDRYTKENLQKMCKFTLCFESTKHEGFVTEKIVDAFVADTIPIYYGSSTIKEIFNSAAFIDISDFKSWNEAIDYIKRVDTDDELYLSILNQPILKKKNYFSDLQEKEEVFIRNIFDQPIESAYRRSRVFAPVIQEQYIKDIKFSAENPSLRIAFRHFLKEKFGRLHLSRKNSIGDT